MAKKGGNPGGGGEASAEYTAALITGGFRFDDVDVTPGKKGGSLHSDSTITMSRPIFDLYDQEMWDYVFDACLPTGVLSDQIDDVFIGRDSWKIVNSGGKNIGAAGSLVIVRLNDIDDDQVTRIAEINFGLSGRLDFEGQFLPPPGEKSCITLDSFGIFGDIRYQSPACKSGHLSLPDNGEVTLEICHNDADVDNCDQVQECWWGQ